MLFRIFLTLIFGSAICLWILQENSLIQHRVINAAITFMEQEWDAQVSQKESKINIFTRSIYMTGGKVVSRKRNCSWSFESGRVSVSLWDLLFRKKISLFLIFNNIVGTTGFMNNQPELVDHLMDIFETEPTALKIKPRSITLNNAHLSLLRGKHTIDISIAGSITLRKLKKSRKKEAAWLGAFITDNGSILVNKTPIISHLKSNTTFTKPISAHYWSIKSDERFSLHAGKKTYPCWLKNTDKHYSLMSTNKKIYAKTSLQNNVRLQGSITRDIIEYVHAAIYRKKAPVNSSKEHVCYDFLVTSTASKLRVNGSASIKNNPFAPLINFNDVVITSSGVKGSLSADISGGAKIKGALNYDNIAQKGFISLWNETTLIPQKQHTSLSLGSWFIPKKKARLVLMIDDKFKVKGSSHITSFNRLSKEKKTAFLKINSQNNRIRLHGDIDSNKLDVRFLLSPHLHLSYFSYKGGENKGNFAYLLASPRDPLKLTGIISYPFIQSFLSYDTQYLVLGKTAQFALAIDQHNLNKITGSIALKKGSLYIPESHNLIEAGDINISFFPVERKIQLSKSSLLFHKGFIKIPQASMSFAPDFSLTSLHCPLEVNDLFLNWKRDLYAFIYGDILISKQQEEPFNVEGSIFLKRSFLKDSIFPESTGDKLFLPPLPSSSLAQEAVAVNLDVATEKPMKIKTQTLDAHANVSFNIRYIHKKDEFNVPKITGTLTLDQGQLKFLQHTLFIEHGRVLFLTQQLNDPIIELTAKNRINKYLITLHATGSLQKPTIILESVPELTEEQILNVLLSGSQETTLQKDLPAILLQNLNVVLMGSKRLPKKTSSWLTRLTRPFKYIQIAPDFTDQSGRGGIKGIVSVSLTEQLHAQFQKNFNLQEDFAFHVGYLLSDDIYLKVVKDQRGELGAELEVRFKL